MANYELAVGVTTEHLASIALHAKFESCLIGTANDRTLFKQATKNMPKEAIEEYYQTYTDLKRSSMNDIGKRARRLAEAFKELEKDGDKT